MRNKLLYILTLCFFGIFANAQTIDIFQNRQYLISTYVLKAAIDKDYSPSSVEILQDKNKEKSKSWEQIENQLNAIAINQINDEVAFFLLHTKAVNYQKQLDERNRLQDRYYDSKSYNPTFSNIDIKLVSVLNNIGTYYIQFNFDRDGIFVRNYYLADYELGKVSNITVNPNSAQQELLKRLTLSKFSTQYLLQTQKLDLGNVERIRSTSVDKDISAEFASKLDYSEAIVYPFFSGIIVEFPALSNSSNIFDTKAFRLLLKSLEVKQLLALYPNFSKAFAKQLSTSSDIILKQLDDDDNFDLSRFQRAPKDLKMLEVLKLSETGKKISSLKITNYQLSDTVKRFMGSQNYLFDTENQLYRIETRDDKDKIYSEQKFNFNKDKQLVDVRYSGNEKQLKLYFYEKNAVSYIENIEINQYSNSSYHKSVNLEISQQHFAYNGNYRYTLDFNIIGDFDRNRTIQSRYIEKNKFCWYDNCILSNENGHIIGVKSNSNSVIDLLIKANNQPIESYVDNDRYSNYFTYDSKNRIQNFTTYSNGKRTDFVEYDYHQKGSVFLKISETKTAYSQSTVILQEFELEF